MGIALHILHVGSLNELLITPCTLEPVQWFSHRACGAGIQAAMRNRLGLGRGGGDVSRLFPASASLLQWSFSSTLPGSRGLVLHEIANEDELPVL